MLFRSKCSSGLERLCSMAGHQPHQRDPNAPSLKRANEWEDSDSPQSSGSLSNQPSPSAGPDGAADEHGSKRKRESLHHPHRPKGALPLTTNDLSLLTFNGRPTFAPQPADGAPCTAGLPSAHVSFAPPLPGNGPAFPQQQLISRDTQGCNRPTGRLQPATAVVWQLDAFGALIPPPSGSQVFASGGMLIEPNNPFGTSYEWGFDPRPGSLDWCASHFLVRPFIADASQQPQQPNGTNLCDLSYTDVETLALIHSCRTLRQCCL